MMRMMPIMYEASKGVNAYLRTEDADKIRDRVLAAKQKNDGSESQASAEEVSSSSRLGAGYSGAVA